MLDQQHGTSALFVFASQMQRRISFRILNIHLGLMIEQILEDFGPALRCHTVQRCVVSVVRYVDVRALFQQELYDL